MNKVVVLDSSPLGLLSNPRRTPEVLACSDWAKKQIANGTRIIVPEIADYEVRRELIRAEKSRGLAELDIICSAFEYLPISSNAMRHAARLWAETRKAGRATASDDALDGDVILVGQALEIIGANELIVASSNTRHLSWFLTAMAWTDIR